MSDFYTSSDIKAVRVPFWCTECGHKVNVGEPATRRCGVFEGDFWQDRAHADCHEAAMLWINHNDLYGEPWPGLAEDIGNGGLPREECSLLEDWPAVLDRIFNKAEGAERHEEAIPESRDT